MFKYMSKIFNGIGAIAGIVVICSMCVDYGRELERRESKDSSKYLESDIFEKLKSKKPYTIKKRGNKYEIEFK